MHTPPVGQPGKRRASRVDAIAPYDHRHGSSPLRVARRDARAKHGALVLPPSRHTRAYNACSLASAPRAARRDTSGQEIPERTHSGNEAAARFCTAATQPEQVVVRFRLRKGGARYPTQASTHESAISEQIASLGALHMAAPAIPSRTGNHSQATCDFGQPAGSGGRTTHDWDGTH
jgi:hypothetical protein